MPKYSKALDKYKKEKNLTSTQILNLEDAELSEQSRPQNTSRQIIGETKAPSQESPVQPKRSAPKTKPTPKEEILLRLMQSSRPFSRRPRHLTRRRRSIRSRPKASLRQIDSLRISYRFSSLKVSRPKYSKCCGEKSFFPHPANRPSRFLSPAQPQVTANPLSLPTLPSICPKTSKITYCWWTAISADRVSTSCSVSVWSRV